MRLKYYLTTLFELFGWILYGLIFSVLITRYLIRVLGKKGCTCKKDCDDLVSKNL